MVFIPQFTGEVSGGRVILDNKEQYRNHLASLEGKRIELAIDKERWTRTIPENRYYFGVIVDMIAMETGHAKDEVHEFLKVKFLGELVHIGGEEVMIGGRTAKLDIEAFENYCERIRVWAQTDLNLRIPLPNEIIINE